jgi:cardiolipin synthase
MRRSLRRVFDRSSDGRAAVGGVRWSVLNALRINHKEPAGRAVQRWRRMVNALLPLGGVSTGNRLTLFKDGDSNFLAMWDAIEKAKTSVWVQTYTLEPDAVGLKTIAVLEDAASRGCDVRLLFDSVGSYNIHEQHVERLQSLGGTVIFYNPVSIRFKFAFLHRNHRKLCLVDGATAFVGGMNISCDYAGVLAGGNSFFADVNVKVIACGVRFDVNVIWF